MKELLDQLSLLESEIDKRRENIVSIQKQMTARIVRKKEEPLTPSEEDWLERAGLALHINKCQLQELNIKRDKLNREIKAAKKKHAVNRLQIKNSLLYKKLKELMTEDELATFIAECDRKVDEATYDEEMEG